MKANVEILIAEDDDGHATLIEKNLRRAGVTNPMHRFADGQEVMNFLFQDDKKPPKACLLLLDLRMPKINGYEVLRRIKRDSRLHQMPVVVVTTTEDPQEIDRCYELGCNNYVTKSLIYEKFTRTTQELGRFLQILEVPRLEEEAMV